MNLLVTDKHLKELPLFPLPGTVFFPNTLLPLHVFEPRYRQLTKFCIDNSWPMAVVLIEPGSLPKTTSGKLQRSATRKQYLQGTLGRVRRRTDTSAVA